MFNTTDFNVIFHLKPELIIQNIGLQCLIHLPAYSGITTIVMQSFDLKPFCTNIQNYKITYSYIAPPVVLHLAKNPIVSDYDLSSLKVITSGAAPLTKDLIMAVHERLGVETKQAYGLSETSPVTHSQVCLFLPSAQSLKLSSYL